MNELLAPSSTDKYIKKSCIKMLLKEEEEEQVFCISLEVRRLPKYIITENSALMQGIRMNKSLILINH